MGTEVGAAAALTWGRIRLHQKEGSGGAHETGGIGSGGEGVAVHGLGNRKKPDQEHGRGRAWEILLATS